MEKIVIRGKSVTKYDVEASILTEEFSRYGKTTTICCMTLGNGFELVGSSACVNVEIFDEKIGQQLAREDALNQVWSHLGAILQNQI